MTTYAGCGKTKGGRYRKHTEIASEKQKALFGAVAGGQKTKATGLSIAEAKRHLRETGSKKLPLRARKRKLRAKK